MARDWHETFKTWAKPPSDTEEEKGSRAASMIRDAVRAYEPLASKNFEVYASGSYRNTTNVRLASDIDVAIVLKDAAYYEFPKSGSPTREELGTKDAAYGLTHFRDDVRKALIVKFGEKGVTPGDKTFNIHENSYRLDADATVFLEHRRYTGKKNSDGTWHYFSGVEMRPISNTAKRIINWHQQHYDQGVARNDATGRRFKRVTRILKRLRDDMREGGTAEQKAAADVTPSFLIECLVFNAPDSCFGIVEGSYYEDVKATIKNLWNATKDDATCSNFVEVSRMKMLFGAGQPWTRDQAHAFLLRVWQRVGFTG
ncbi:MAG: nucleotidyltransferase domain-containing protein [Polyangiaceae bacterium]|nr:nucleotidyltransferase domain-containing protein [Polyangiaceae bacterium]